MRIRRAVIIAVGPMKWYWRVGRLGVLIVGALGMFSLTGCLERLAYHPSRVMDETPHGFEDVWFTSSDGTRLHGWFLPAVLNDDDDAAQDSPAPTVLAVHGNAGNISSHVSFVDFLPRYGVNVLIFDYRGYGKSDAGKLRRDLLYQDTQAALDYLLTRSDVDSQRIGIYAQSLGCSFGLSVMADRPEVGSAVVMSPFQSWQLITATVLAGGQREPGPLARFLSRCLMRRGLDPADAIASIRDRPILLIHGRDDEVVPFWHSKRLTEIGGSNVIFRPVDGGDHNSLRWIDPRLDVEMAAFFRRTLPSKH